MKKIKIVIVVLVIGGLAAAGIGKYFFDKKVEGVSEVKAEFTMSCDSIYNAFSNDEIAANKIYIGKIVEVSGKVHTIEKDMANVSIMLSTTEGMGFVICRLDSAAALTFKGVEGQNLKLKGECVGYMMPDVNISRCVIVK
jgi:hypothetical protein